MKLGIENELLRLIVFANGREMAIFYHFHGLDKDICNGELEDFLDD